MVLLLRHALFVRTRIMLLMNLKKLGFDVKGMGKSSTSFDPVITGSRDPFSLFNKKIFIFTYI
jgi:hypothetical protein